MRGLQSIQVFSWSEIITEMRQVDKTRLTWNKKGWLKSEHSGEKMPVLINKNNSSA